MKFGYTPEETKKLNDWFETKSFQAHGTIGGRYTYSFTPTTLGEVKTVTDTIKGDTIDLTDYMGW